MSFSGKATYSAGATLPELVEDVSDLVAVASNHETPLLDALGDAARFARSTIHEWMEDAPVAETSAISAVGSETSFTLASATRFRAGDIVQVGASAELARITAINLSSGVATMARAYGGTTEAGAGTFSMLTLVTRAAIEGADAEPARFTNRTRVSNATQIFTASLEVSGTQQAVALQGVRDEVDYQKAMRLRELIRDLEKAVVRGVAPASDAQGTSSAPRTLRGIVSFLSTNVADAGDLIDDATSLTEPLLNLMLRRIWSAGAGAPDLIVVGGREKRHINEFVASNRRFFAVNESFKDMVSTYESDFGVCRVVLCRHVPDGTVLLLDSSRLQVLPLAARSFHYKPLANTGDAEKGQLIGECTLELRNEAAHGMITGLTA